MCIRDRSRELAEAFSELRDNDDLKVGIITAEGRKIFSAGWDLKALNKGEIKLENWWDEGDYGDGGFAGLTENWSLNKPICLSATFIFSNDANFLPLYFAITS